MAYLVDRPEGNALNDLSSHTAITSKRWIYLSMVDPDRLVSCPHCFKHRLSLILSIKQDHSTTSRSCQKCSDFEYNSSNSSVKINLNYLNIIPTIRTIFLCATRINKVYYLANITNHVQTKKGREFQQKSLIINLFLTICSILLFEKEVV